jgi:hypothetical protein
MFVKRSFINQQLLRVRGFIGQKLVFLDRGIEKSFFSDFIINAINSNTFFKRLKHPINNSYVFLNPGSLKLFWE